VREIFDTTFESSSTSMAPLGLTDADALSDRLLFAIPKKG